MHRVLPVLGSSKYFTIIIIIQQTNLQSEHSECETEKQQLEQQSVYDYIYYHKQMCNKSAKGHAKNARNKLQAMIRHRRKEEPLDEDSLEYALDEIIMALDEIEIDE